MPSFKPHTYDKTANFINFFEDKLQIHPFVLSLHHQSAVMKRILKPMFLRVRWFGIRG